MQRRTFLRASSATAVAAASATAAMPVLISGPAAAEEVNLLFARRPEPPYRVWFQPVLFHRDIDLYRNMTIDASGWIDPQLAEGVRKTSLDWAYGLNHPTAQGPEDWSKLCTVKGRTHPRKSDQPRFVSAGPALDEWVPPKLPGSEQWLGQGLRDGKRENPDVFIAIWNTDPTPALIELGKDSTVDLFIVEGYTHSDPAAGPGLVSSWETALRRCDALVKGGQEAKTICSFGHINLEARHQGKRLSGKWLRERMKELKERYPRMPGVGFYQTKSPDTPELRELVKTCDRLSAEFWPSA